jgi:transposase
MSTDQVRGKPTSRRYSPEEKAAAVRMVRALRAELGTEHGTVQRVARQLGYGIESVRAWVRQADIDDGYTPGVSTSEAQRIKDLEQENRELKRANEILKRAASFFGAELDANTASSRVHRRQPRRVRGRAHLHRPALGSGVGGPEHLLRGQDPSPVDPGLPGRDPGTGAQAIMGGQLSRLRRSQALESRPPRRS